MADDTAHGNHPNYKAIFGVLMVLTVTSVIADQLGGVLNKPAIIVIVMAVSTLKATCVMMYFMHLKFEGNWKYVLLAPTTILAMGLPLALMPDIGIPYYQDMSLQEREWQTEIDEEEHYEQEHAEETRSDHDDESSESPAEESADTQGRTADNKA